MALVGANDQTSTSSGSSATLTIAPLANFPSDSVIVVVFAVDNSGTSGANPFQNITDTPGNTWYYPVNQLRTPGSAANDGTVLVMAYSYMDVRPLITSDSIVAHFSPNINPRPFAVHKITSDIPGASIVFVTSGSTVGAGNSTITTGTIPIGDMVIGASADEYGTAQTPTHDSDSTNGSWSTAMYQEVGTTGAGQNIATQRKVQTTTPSTQTYNVSYGTSSDWAIGWLQFHELEPVSTPRQKQRFLQLMPH